jgi:NACalpha-BTF3-like transcription factor
MFAAQRFDQSDANAAARGTNPDREVEMEITLEKIELVKDRTGVSYKEAKEALEAADGSVVDAIINIEETINMSGRGKMSAQGVQILEKIREAVRKGNVTKIVVKKDGDILLNLPVNAGIIGTVLAPWPVLFGALAALGTHCVIELIKDDGQVVEISEIAAETFGGVLEKGAGIVEDVRVKGADVFESVRSKTRDAMNRSKTDAENDDEEADEDDTDKALADDTAEAGYVSTAADNPGGGDADGAAAKGDKTNSYE